MPLGRSCRLVSGIALGFVLAASTQCQDKLAAPEYFGFYAADGGRTVALYEGQGSGASSTRESDVYSIPKNASFSLKLPAFSSSARFILFYSNGGEMVQAMTLHRLPHLRNIVETTKPPASPRLRNSWQAIAS